jgi:hypothetical protein
MALQFQDVSEKDLAKGIDSYSSRTNIQPGMAEDLLNVDTNANGALVKRKGSQLYYGYVPLRVEQISHSGTSIALTFDDSQSIDLNGAGVGPIVVYGKVPSADAPGGGYAGDFSTTNAVRYYSSYTIDNRDSLAAPSGTITKAATDHGLATKYMFVGVGETTDYSTNSHSVIILDNIGINESTYAVAMNYTIASTTDGIVYYKEKASETGVTYIKTGVAAALSVTVNAATHNLSTFNIGVKCFDTNISAGVSTEVIPVLVTIDATGEVVVTFGAAFTGYIIYTQVGLTNVKAAVPVLGSNSITIVNPDNPFNFFYIYFWDGSTSKWNSVIPDDIAYDEATDTITISYSLATASESVEIYYESGVSVSNRLRITDTGSVNETYTSTTPQLTVWGIPHANLYNDDTLRGGHLNHIDNYKGVLEERIICGLGGNIFSAQARSENSNDTTYLMPSLLFDGGARINGDTEIDALFHTNASTSTRTRGVIKDATVSSSNLATITAANYVSSGVVNYTITWTNKTGTIADGGVLDLNYDYLTVSGMANNVHNGVWKITSIVSDSTTSTVIRCANTGVVNATTDEAGAMGKAGVFTDKVTLENATHYIAGDRFLSSAISSSFTNSIVATNGAAIYLNGVTGAISLPDGVKVYVQRLTDVIPLRSSGGSASVTNFVRGDVIDVNSITNKPKIVNINVNASESVSIVGDGTTATATVTSTTNYNVGMKLFIYGTVDYDGAVEIATIPSATTFTFSSTASSSKTGTLLGYTIHIDESITVIDDTSPTTFTVEGRWITVEAPTNADNLPAATTVYHFAANEYDSQPALRSVMVKDNLYLTNQDDEVMKFDGTNIYRTGLPRWQPQLFVNIDTSTSSLAKGYTVAYTACSRTAGTFTVATAAFKAGDRIYDSVTGVYFTVVDVVLIPGATETYNITVNDEERSSITDPTTTGNLTLARTFKYYARLNMIDTNNNIIAAAATGYNDMLVELAVDGQIHLKLVGMPVWDSYDYDRIELEVYRTMANQSAPYYLINRQVLSFDHADGYVEIQDGTPDSYLLNLDEPHSSILGNELGTSWQQPNRAKYITSIDNKLILANLKSFQYLDVSLVKTGSVVTAANLAGLTYLFRKDNTDTSTTTDMINRVKYEYVNSGTVTLLPRTTTFTVDAGVAGDVIDNSGLQFNETAHGLTTGTKVWVSSAGTLPTGLSASTDYYVIRVDADNIKFATSITNANAGTAIAWTDDGTGVHTVTPKHIITVAATSFTVEKISHGLAAGDWIYAFHAAKGTNNDLTFAGWWQVASVTTHTFSVDLVNSATVSLNDIDSYVTATAKSDVPVWIGTDGNYNNRDGNLSTSVEYIASLRLSNAVNATMRMTDTTITAMSSFIPWLSAGGGNDWNLGQCYIEVPKVINTTAELVIGTIPSTANIFVNNIKRSSDEQVGAYTNVQPSRVIVSYPNFPEVFDAPNGAPNYSDSVVDVNAADGQEITGVIPFFGISTFGGSQLNQVLVVFKTNSIYVLDSATRLYQKIDSRGLGCTAPHSISATKDGIMFANESGIYRLNRDMSISYVGKYMQGKWKNNVNKDALTEAQGHQYGVGRKYKLSIPTDDSLFPNEVFVYDMDREGQGVEFGAWTRYDSHNATGWCNQREDAFWCSQEGEVFKVRNLNEVSDFRDDADAISSVITLKSDDFGLANVRKVVNGVSLTLEYEELTSLVVQAAINLGSTFESVATIAESSNEDVVVKCSLPKRKLTHLQLKLTHATIDEDIALSGVSYSLGRLDVRGTTQSSDRT